MDNRGIKVRVFDMDHGLREYDNIKIVRIIGKIVKQFYTHYL